MRSTLRLATCAKQLPSGAHAQVQHGEVSVPVTACGAQRVLCPHYAVAARACPEDAAVQMDKPCCESCSLTCLGTRQCSTQLSCPAGRTHPSCGQLEPEMQQDQRAGLTMLWWAQRTVLFTSRASRSSVRRCGGALLMSEAARPRAACALSSVIRLLGVPCTAADFSNSCSIQAAWIDGG